MLSNTYRRGISFHFERSLTLSIRRKNQFECAPLPRTVISPPGNYYNEVTHKRPHKDVSTMILEASLMGQHI